MARRTWLTSLTPTGGGKPALAVRVLLEPGNQQEATGVVHISLHPGLTAALARRRRRPTQQPEGVQRTHLLAPAPAMTLSISSRSSA